MQSMETSPSSSSVRQTLRTTEINEPCKKAVDLGSWQAMRQCACAAANLPGRFVRQDGQSIRVPLEPCHNISALSFSPTLSWLLQVGCTMAAESLRVASRLPGSCCLAHLCQHLPTPTWQQARRRQHRRQDPHPDSSAPTSLCLTRTPCAPMSTFICSCSTHVLSLSRVEVLGAGFWATVDRGGDQGFGELLGGWGVGG